MDSLTAIGVVASLVFGVAGVVVGIVGLNASKRANTLSARANEIAREANETALRSVAQVEAADARALEHHAVEWSMGWDSRHLFWVRNDGRHTAHRTFIRVTIDDQVERVDQELDVAPREAVRLQFDAVTAAWQREDQARAAHQHVEQTRSITFVHGDYKPPLHSVRVQIWWRTVLSTPRDYEHDFTAAFSVTDP